MLNINFVFKLSNCFISLTLSANKKPLRTTNQRPVSRSRDHSQPIRGQYPVWTMSCNSPCVLMFTGWKFYSRLIKVKIRSSAQAGRRRAKSGIWDHIRIINYRRPWYLESKSVFTSNLILITDKKRQVYFEICSKSSLRCNKSVVKYFSI